QAVRLSHERFAPDTEDLVKTLAKVVSERERSPWTTAAARPIEMGSREWRASLVSRSQDRFVMRIEAATEVHILELEFKPFRFRDRFVLDGKEEWFFVWTPNVRKQFRIGNYPDVFEFRVTLRTLGGIKDVELLRNNTTIFAD